MKTIRLTMAQALVRYLCNQRIRNDGQDQPLFAGVFGIFGHGNVTCLSEALEAVQDILPTWRGQNEQSMALAAIGFAKARRRRQIMVAASSIGPGAANMVTAAAAAHANRLPVLLLAGDVFASRHSRSGAAAGRAFRRSEPDGDRCLQGGDPILGSHRPAGADHLGSLPQAVAIMLDPADCGPTFLALCQDTQGEAYDYPERFFEPQQHEIRRQRPDRRRDRRGPCSAAPGQAAADPRRRRRALSVAGERLAAFAAKHRIPVAETIAGRGVLAP